jgi:Superinfection immunity protein
MYFLPTIIAFNRNRHNKGAIFVLNLFLGWTVLGWVVSMVWAVSSSQPPVIVVQGQQPPRP